MVTVMTETGMDDAPIPDNEARNLKFLRRLVTTLTATMILGVLAIVALLVIRLQTPAGPALPPTITLPDGIGRKKEIHEMDAGIIAQGIGYLKNRSNRNRNPD